MHFRNNQKFWLIATVLFLVNFILKMKDVELQPITLDEPFSIFVAQFSVTEIVSYLSQGNNPPLYEILLHYWIKLFGVSPTTVRFPSVVLSSLVAVCIFYLGKKTFSQRIGIFAAAFFTLSNYQMFFAHQARGYAMALLLLCISMIFFLRILEKKSNRFEAVLYILSSTLLIYSHYFGLFVLFVQFIWVVAQFAHNRSKALYFFKLFGIVGLLYLPNIAVLLRQFLITSSSGTWVQPVSGWGDFSYFIWFFGNSNNLIFILIILLAGILSGIKIMKTSMPSILKYLLVFTGFLVFLYLVYIRVPFDLNPTIKNLYVQYGDTLGLKLFIGVFLLFLIVISIRRYWTEQSKTAFIMLWFFVPLSIMFISSIWIPMFLPQYLFIISPAFVILLAAGLDNILGKSNPTFLVLFLVTFSLTFRLMIDTNRDIVELTDYIKANKTENTAVFVSPPYFDLCFTYHYNLDWFRSITAGEIEKGTRKILKKNNIHIVHWTKDIDQFIIKNSKHVIYVDGESNIHHPNLKLNKVFEQQFNAADTVLVFPEIYRLSEYSK